MKTSILFTKLTLPTMILLALVGVATTARAAPEGFANQVLMDTPAAYWRLNERNETSIAEDSLCEADFPQSLSKPNIESTDTLQQISDKSQEVCRDGLTQNRGMYVDPGIVRGAQGIGGGDTGAVFNGTSDVISVLPFTLAACRFGFRRSTLSPGLITMEAVIRWDGPISDPPRGFFQRIIEKSQFPQQATYGLSINEANGRVHVELTTGPREPSTVLPPVSLRTLQSNTQLFPGAAVHLVATYDGRMIRLFINGVLDSEEDDFDPPQAQALVANSESGVAIGNRAIIGVNNDCSITPPEIVPGPFNGLLDEVVLYDQVLSPERIFAHTSALLGGTVNPDDELAPGLSKLP